jgi:tripartite-type tricarboxylate transporter receptor subunit TctC
MKKLLNACSLVLLVAGFGGSAAHAAFPEQPVKIIVGFPPGGGQDMVSRLLASRLPQFLGQPVVVENRPGASGIIGARAVVSAKPDGHTLFSCGISTHGTGPALAKNYPFDAERDFSPITLVATNANVLVVNPAVPAKTVAEYVAWAKAGGGKHNYASTGPGGTPQLSMEAFKRAAGFELVAIPYKGDAPAQQDLVGNHVSTLFSGIAQQLQAVKSGLTRPIAVTSTKRHPLLPDVPTLDESGYPGFEVVSWTGLCAPAGTPEPVLNALHDAITKALNVPAVRDQLVRDGWEPVGSTRKDFGAYISKEIARWRKFVASAGIALN